MKVVNLFAGPGAGKSTTAAGLFHLMKLEGMNVELVTEYAKDMTWEKRHNILTDQLYMFAKQRRRITRLEGSVDFVVTDSPLLLFLVYAPKDYPPSWKQLVLDLWNSYLNVNFYIDRVKRYAKVGRSQTEDEARGIDRVVKGILEEHRVPFTCLPGDAEAPRRLLEALR
jgi:ABC-type oligopeptide transport system ATPase subunit